MLKCSKCKFYSISLISHLHDIFVFSTFTVNIFCDRIFFFFFLCWLFVYWIVRMVVLYTVNSLPCQTDENAVCPVWIFFCSYTHRILGFMYIAQDIAYPSDEISFVLFPSNVHISYRHKLLVATCAEVHSICCDTLEKKK